MDKDLPTPNSPTPNGPNFIPPDLTSVPAVRPPRTRSSVPTPPLAAGRRQKKPIIKLTAEMARHDFHRLEPGNYYITWEAAEILLERNNHNRNFKKGGLTDYTAMIKKGWKLNGQPIIFNDLDELHDGQHRLRAAVEAKQGFETVIIFDIPHDSFDTVDRGQRRTAGDDFSSRHEKNHTQLAAICNLAHAYAKHHAPVLASRKKPKVESGELIDFLEKHPTLRESTSFAVGNRIPGISLTTVGFVHFVTTKQFGPDLVEEFFTRVRTGENLTAGDPRLLLRNRISTKQKAKLSDPYVLALVVKAWNAFVAGKKMQQLAWRNEGPKPEPFPNFVGLRTV